MVILCNTGNLTKKIWVLIVRDKLSFFKLIKLDDGVYWYKTKLYVKLWEYFL